MSIANPDATLLALIAQFDTLERRINDLYPDGATPIEDEDSRDKVAEPLRNQQESLLEHIVSTHAVTTEAIVARAHSLVLYAPHFVEEQDHGGYWDQRMIAAVLRDLLAVGAA